MRRKEIEGDGYLAWFDGAQVTACMEGSLRLATRDYDPISELLKEALDTAVAASTTRFTLDLRRLEFLNSSGINMLYKFAIALRKCGRDDLTLVIQASTASWQARSLQAIKKFYAKTEIDLKADE